MRSLTAAARWAAAASAALTMAFAGCGGTEDEPSGSGPTATNPVPTPDPPEFTAELISSRHDDALGQVRVRLTNNGDDPITLDVVQLVAPPYTPAPARLTGGVTLDAGRTIAYPVEHGEPTCPGPTPTPGPITVEVEAGTYQVTVDPGESAQLIDRLLTLHCGRQQVAELVTIALDTEWDVGTGGREQTGTLTITRRTDGPPVTLIAVRGGINYTLDLHDPAGQLTLEPGHDVISIPVRTRGVRCDGHAIGDNSKPYTFAAWVSVDGGPEIHVEFDARDQPANFDRLCEAGS